MWFIFALITTLSWGCADLFYKKSSDSGDRYSHLKIAVWVGLVMGICSLLTLPASESGWQVLNIVNLIKYAPASFSYIISMIIGYAGMRYLEISVISPVQNASGAFSMAAMIMYFAFKKGIKSALKGYTAIDFAGTLLIIAGVVLLAVVEQRLSAGEKALNPQERKYKYGALALAFPLLYCLFDTIGTSADGIILAPDSGINLGETDVIVLYGLTFFIVGIGCWTVLLFKTKKPYNPFKDRDKCAAALFEEGGQVFYVYAMAKNPVVAAPMVASYCVISVILSRIFLKEKLKRAQYMCVICVIAGIILLGISEGLAEL